MSIVRLFIVICFVAVAGQAQSTSEIPEPFPIAIEREQAVLWNSFEHLPPLAGAIPVTLSSAPVRALGRVDILRRNGRRWRWLSKGQFTTRMALPVEGDFDRGILLRFERSGSYFWTEVKAGESAAVTLRPFKNVRVLSFSEGTSIALYLSSEDKPRTNVEAGAFRFVDITAALACATVGETSRCVNVPPPATAAEIGGMAVGDTRVLHVSSQGNDAYSCWQRGNVPLRPRAVSVSVQTTGSWVALSLPDAATSWANVVIDRTGADFALERIEGAVLDVPPAFSEVPSRSERGVSVRAYVGDRRTLLTDRDAVLAIFPATSGSAIASAIPVAVVKPDTSGLFNFPSVGAGAFRLSLSSAQAAPGVVTVDAVPGIAVDVVFPTGPTVRGRIVRTTGGTATDPINVTIADDRPLQQVIAEGDSTDRMRAVVADENGAFRIVAPLPGYYRLVARWGASTAERKFEVNRPDEDVDLGEIVANNGATLRGEVARCANGEAVAIIVPDFSKAPRFDMINAQIDANGKFVISGLVPGKWSVSIKCDGKPVRTVPGVIAVPESGDVVILFKRQDDEPHP